MSRMGQAPLVSVVMSVHNGRPYLAHAVESILAQTFRGFEFIIIDDGSTDGSTDDLAEYAKRDDRVRLFVQKNSGLATALNAGLKLARGKYIARMDADDVAHPDRLMAQTEHMTHEPNLVLLGTAFEYVDSIERHLKHQPVSTDNATLQLRLIEECNQFCHPSVMMRVSSVRDLDGYRAVAGCYAQDYDLWLRLSEVGEIANLVTPLLRYRVHTGQISVNNLFEQRRAAEIYRSLARQRRTSGQEDIKAALKEVDGLRHSLKNAVAGDCLHWGDLFYRIGDVRRARLMCLRALWVAPFSIPVRRMVRNGLGQRLRALRGFW